MLEQKIEELSNQLYEERRKVSTLELELRTESLKASEAKEMSRQLEDLRGEKRSLETRIKILTADPWNKDKDTISSATAKELQEKYNELKKRYDALRDENDKNKETLDAARIQLKVVSEDRDKFKDEKTKSEAILKDRENNRKFFDDQMKMLNLDNERDKDSFLRALGLVKL
jgi:chromosome segregation ATPase